VPFASGGATENVGVDVSSFALGATVNMDGTSLYQAVAAIL
jgi:Na+/H+-dicarboxylate symporter